jgi:fermentation-respiration switch protein FrsA (DUF1100 family)
MQGDMPLETAEALIEYKPEALVERLAPRPLLLIHGVNDRLTPVDESQSLFQRAGEPRRLEVIPTMDHFNWVLPHNPGFSQVTHKVVNFLQEFLPLQ